MLSLSEWRSREFQFLKWLNIGYICYIHCPVLILYIHHVAHQGKIGDNKQSIKTISPHGKQTSQLNQRSTPTDINKPFITAVEWLHKTWGDDSAVAVAIQLLYVHGGKLLKSFCFQSLIGMIGWADVDADVTLLILKDQNNQRTDLKMSNQFWTSNFINIEWFQ